MVRGVSAAVRSVPPSGIRKFFDIAAAEKDIISLGVGEPDFDTPKFITRAGVQDLQAGGTHYTSNWGKLELRALIAERYRKRSRAEYDPRDEVLVTVGASEAVDLAVRAVCDPGDEFIVVDPSYVCYRPDITFAHGKVVTVDADPSQGFNLDPDAIRAAVTPRTKAIIINNPCNPTGALYPRKTVEAVCEVARDADCYLVSDEIYEDLVYGEKHTSVASVSGMKDHAIVISGFSKGFAMTGWRLGFACGAREVVGAMMKVHQYSIMCAPTPAQAAAVVALRSKQTAFSVEKMRREYDRRRRLIVKGFNKMGLKCHEPHGAFYAFPSIESTGLEADEFCERSIKEARVAVVPGSAFGLAGEGHFRASYATAYGKIERALERLEAFVSGL
jgi:aminotransferase